MRYISDAMRNRDIVVRIVCMLTGSLDNDCKSQKGKELLEIGFVSNFLYRRPMTLHPTC